MPNLEEEAFSLQTDEKAPRKEELHAWELRLKEEEKFMASYSLEVEKLRHQHSVEKFKLAAKTTVSLFALLIGIHLHQNDDSLGAFLIGSGLGGFDVTMAASPHFPSKED